MKNKKILTRNEKIDFLVKDKIGDWVFAKNWDGLALILEVGFSGFENFSDEELDAALEGIDFDSIQELIKDGAYDNRDIPFLKNK